MEEFIEQGTNELATEIGITLERQQNQIGMLANIIDKLQEQLKVQLILNQQYASRIDRLERLAKNDHQTQTLDHPEWEGGAQ